MSLFKKKDFNRLSEVSAPHCVSIYMPTHREAHQDNQYKDKTSLKNALKEVSKQLKAYQMDEGEIDGYLSEASALMENEDFWKSQSDGLVVFIYDDTTEFFKVPVKLNDYTFIANHLYTKPLAEMLKDDGRHFIMAISLGELKFFEATEHSITPVVMEGLVPQTMLESVGFDVEERSLQHHSGNGGNENAMFHGQGRGEETEKKTEILKYFRDVNDGLMKMIHDEDAPLVLACVDYLYPIYKEANTYNHLHDEFISGNHEHTDPIELKEKSWSLVKEEFMKDRAKAFEQFNNTIGTGNSSYHMDKVIPAAVGGRVDKLFYREGEHLWGTYDESTHKIEADTVHRTGNTDLINMAVEATIKNGGCVYKLRDDEMEDIDSSVMAVMRY